MQDFLETECFALPQQVKSDLALRMKGAKDISGVEFELNGEMLEDAKEFTEMLVALKKRGRDLMDQVGLNAADKAMVLGGTAKLLLNL